MFKNKEIKEKSNFEIDLNYDCVLGNNISQNKDLDFFEEIEVTVDLASCLSDLEKTDRVWIKMIEERMLNYDSLEELITSLASVINVLYEFKYKNAKENVENICIHTGISLFYEFIVEGSTSFPVDETDNDKSLIYETFNYRYNTIFCNDELYYRVDRENDEIHEWYTCYDLFQLMCFRKYNEILKIRLSIEKGYLEDYATQEMVKLYHNTENLNSFNNSFETIIKKLNIMNLLKLLVNF